MEFLIVTILLNIVISIFFRLAPSWGVDRLQVVVANYVVCLITGFLISGPATNFGGHAAPWLPWAALTGVGFFAVFSVIAACTGILGISKTVVANKLSIVIPVTFAVMLNGDHIGVLKGMGMLLSVPAVMLVSGVGVGGDKLDKKGISMLVTLFLGGGLLDAMLNHVQSHYPDVATHPAFTTFSFGFAAAIGAIILMYRVANGTARLQAKNWAAGVALGLPNFFSIYCYIKMMHSPFLQPSASIPVLNIGILTLSAVVGGLLFKEMADYKRIIGILVSVLAVIAIGCGDKL